MTAALTAEYVKGIVKALRAPIYVSKHYEPGKEYTDPARVEAANLVEALYLAALPSLRQAASPNAFEVLTAEAIEAGAQALVNDHWHPPQKLSSINRSEADRWRKQARLVLEAAMKSAPQVRTSQQAEMQPNGDTAGCGAGTVAQAVPDSLRAAAERVCWFDWSDNDMDACAAMDALRKALTVPSASQGTEA